MFVKCTCSFQRTCSGAIFIVSFFVRQSIQLNLPKMFVEITQKKTQVLFFLFFSISNPKPTFCPAVFVRLLSASKVTVLSFSLCSGLCKRLAMHSSSNDQIACLLFRECLLFCVPFFFSLSLEASLDFSVPAQRHG